MFYVYGLEKEWIPSVVKSPLLGALDSAGRCRCALVNMAF